MLNSKQIKLRVAKQTKLVAQMGEIKKQAYNRFRLATTSDYNASLALEKKMFTSQMEHECAEQVLFALTTTLEKVIEIEAEYKKSFGFEA